MNNILSNFDRTTCGLALKVLSTVSTGLYAGSAFYVSFVDNPARMTHDPVSAITMWKPSFVRAKRMQVKPFFSIAILNSLKVLSMNDNLDKDLYLAKYHGFSVLRPKHRHNTAVTSVMGENIFPLGSN